MYIPVAVTSRGRGGGKNKGARGCWIPDVSARKKTQTDAAVTWGKRFQMVISMEADSPALYRRHTKAEFFQQLEGLGGKYLTDNKSYVLRS